MNPGATVLNLDFSISFRMTQQEKNAKVLQQIRNELAQWANKHLPMAARILVKNQVIMASIWYIENGACNVLNKARSMVRNFT